MSLLNSYEHTYGHIKYNVKVAYDISDDSSKEYVGYFFVEPVADLNNSDELNINLPLKDARHKRFGYLWWQTEPLNMINVIPKRGWVPGETIPMAVQIENNSTVKIKKVRLSLIEKVTFVTKKPRRIAKTEFNVLKEQLFGTSIEPCQTKLLEAELYLYPEYEWKIFNGSKLIICEYFIKTEAIVRGLHRNFDNPTLITIGTVPLTNNNAAPVSPKSLLNASTFSNKTDSTTLPSYHEISSPNSNKSIWSWGLNDSGNFSTNSKNSTQPEPIGFVVK